MRANIDAWTREIDDGGLEAIVVTASGCGTTIKDYGASARRRSGLRRQGGARRRARQRRDANISPGSTSPSPRRTTLVVAYHAACSLQHGQKITSKPPKALLRRAGFDVRDVRPKATSAAARRGPTTSCSRRSPRRCAARKVANLERLKPDVIAAGNIGCLTQIASATAMPVVHTVELLDWASGGPAPARRRGLTFA